MTGQVGPSGESTIVTVFDETIIFTDTQIKASPSGVLTLLAAQGANTIIIPHLVVFRSRIVTPYGDIGSGADAANGASIYLTWGTGTGQASNVLPNDNSEGFSSVTDLLTNDNATGIVTCHQTPSVNQGSDAFFTLTSEIANQPLVIKVINLVATVTTNFSGGNAANKLLVNFSYQLVDISGLS